MCISFQSNYESWLLFVGIIKDTHHAKGQINPAFCMIDYAFEATHFPAAGISTVSTE